MASGEDRTALNVILHTTLIMVPAPDTLAGLACLFDGCWWVVDAVVIAAILVVLLSWGRRNCDVGNREKLERI